ncbi:espin-like [Dreissena polymorpha]|uniref:espin-like n=1 Tax=Dreissena polymorpha TaxID=45954 RepID=UPI002264F73B|nr:espin-like [Dreissena polymorpha]
MFEMVAKEVSEAIENDDLEAVKQLSSKVLNPSLIDEHGCNSLHLAARHSGPDLIAFLVNQRGFKATERSNIGATPCHDAAAAGNLEALKWLVRNTTCNVNNQDGTGATALHLACRFHHTQVTEWLLDEAKADSSKVTSSDGLPLHFAVVGGDYDAVKLLLEDDPSSANLQISNGATASYLAAQEGHIEILRLLISEYRGNVKVKAYDGMSVVHAAAQSGHLDCVRFLVDEEKCNPNDRDFDGATPLHYAASQGHDLVIDWLMKVGGAKVTLDNLGGSPLHNAAECNQIECVKVLIRNGCSIEITDNNGLTAAELAKKCFHEKCANIIATYKPQSQADVILKGTKQQPLTPEVVVNGIQSRSPARARSPEAGYSINRSKGEYSKGASRPKSPDLTFIRKQTLHSDDSFIPRLDLGHSGVHSDVTGPSNEPRRRFSLSNSESDASHSSLSQLDDVIAFAEKTVAKETKKNYELVKEKMDRANFGIEGESEQFKPKVQNLRTVKVDSVSQQAKKGVTFSEATEHINDTDDALYDDAFSKPPETHILGQQKVNVKNQTKAFENGGIKGGQHGTGTNMEKITGHFSRTALAEDGPAALLTPEMMQAQYGALSPTNTRMAIDNSANSDFISELKEATKGGALKKMSKNTRLEDKLSPTPITVFSSGQKIDIVNGGVSHETEPKMELKGEWDPKNFIDQVPNRGDLPAWKVQLAAKQIAEKAMKETLEKRKVEEREARFKDMPAWKRAIVERKEAEARSAEEKRQAEEQQRAQHSSNKRVPHVQVMPKSGDKSLAPWQLELQHK